jgi:Ca2+/H+ antiporter
MLAKRWPLIVPIAAMAVLAFALPFPSGRTNMMPGGVHLVIFAAFLFLALVP